MSYTHLLLIVDRSGSMMHIRQAAESGLKGFIAEQRTVPGKLTISLWEFDHHVDRVPDNKVDSWMLLPRGTTALLDAIGTAVTDTGRELAEMDEADRPDKVIAYIVTDGMENASTEWSRKRVFDLIDQQRTKYSWEFLFSAADQDAITVGAGLGIRPQDAFRFHGTNSGVGQTYTVASAAVRGYRG